MNIYYVWFFLAGLLGGYLIKTITGASGQYLGDKFTDQRRIQERKAVIVEEERKEREATEEERNSVWSEFPEICRQLAQHLLSQPRARRFHYTVVMGNNSIDFDSCNTKIECTKYEKESMENRDLICNDSLTDKFIDILA